MNVVRNNIIQIDQAGAPHFTVVQQPVQLEEVGGRHQLQDVGGLHAQLLGGAFVEVLHHRVEYLVADIIDLQDGGRTLTELGVQHRPELEGGRDQH